MAQPTPKAKSALDEVSATGAFVRTAAGFRNWIKEGSEFPPEADRYHLYISYACPWASRCLALYYMKGLENVIGLSVVHPTWQRTKPDNQEDQHTGWVFRSPGDAPLSNTAGHGSYDCSDCIPDTVNGFKTVRDLYEKSKDTTGKYSVPVLWDKKLSCIVNNESSEILQMFNNQFDTWATNASINIYPEELAEEVESFNSWIYPGINDGVYKCGFALTQGAYEGAFKSLFEAMDKLEGVLTERRYLCGNKLTSADIRAFVTLVRFDEVYFVYFKTNKKLIRKDYPNIFNYIKDIYQLPGVAKSVNMKHIKMHYYTAHPKLNLYGIIPVGNPDDFSTPHDRDRFSK